MNIGLDQRPDGMALYLDGNLQFDSRDERLYHESLVLPALSMARTPKRVLICGGGDGLALREVLRFPGVDQVDLVDYSPEVLDLGRNQLAGLNGGSLHDPRATVHCVDAWAFLDEVRGLYDVIICDFAFPLTEEDARIHSTEWYARLNAALAEGGVLAVNAVSPEKTPRAFSCLVRTIRASGFASCPYRVCIPSFREAGYGCWGFVLAARNRATLVPFLELACPVETKQADIRSLARGARFSRAYRQGMRMAPVHSLSDPALIRLLKPASVTDQPLPGLDGLIQSIPAQHPYHTREMIEELAWQVCGSITKVDLRRLLDEIWKRAAELPKRLREELAKLREFVQDRFFRIGDSREWSSRLFAALLIVMTLANSLAPDNAFAKGAHGLGHSSFSRGFAGEGSMHGAFGRHAPVAEEGAITSRGFSTSYGRRPVDIYGQPYVGRTFYYSDWGYTGHYYGGGGSYGGGSSSRSQSPPAQDAHQPLFVADDDLLVMDNGDVVITLSDEDYLLLRKSSLQLMSHTSPKPVADLYLQPKLLEAVQQQIQDQQATAQAEITNRRDWLAWVGWTDALFPQVQQDQTELRNLRALDRKLSGCLVSVGQCQPGPAFSVPDDRTELFVGCYVAPDLTVEVYDPKGQKTTYVPARLKTENPALANVLKSVLAKMSTELTADIALDDHDLGQLNQEETSCRQDLTQYNQIYSSNGFDGTYQVDYGTDEIGVHDAISRTNQELSDVAQQRSELETQRAASVSDFLRMSQVLQLLS